MALFLNCYYYIPEEDFHKTTLSSGNPHRPDHIIIGAILKQASLYKPPQHEDFQSYWLWDDPDFDPIDPQPSERLVLEAIYQTIQDEIDRIYADQQIRFKHHYLIGYQLHQQLGFLYQRAVNITSKKAEKLYHAFMNAEIIDLGNTLSTERPQKYRKHLKPVYLPNYLKNNDIGTIMKQEQISSLYQELLIEQLENQAEDENNTIQQVYYDLLAH